MRQLDLDGASDEIQDSAAAHDQSGEGAITAAVLTQPPVLHPTGRGIMQTTSFLHAPVACQSVDDSGREKAGRHVRFQYLAQLFLTTAPLIALDLGLLGVIVLAAKHLLLFLELPPGLDLSTGVLPIATGFLLISAEMGLYPGIRLSPVEEFRRLAMAVTSIFAVWIVGVAMLSGGLSLSRWIFLLTAYLLYLICLPICRSTLRRALAKWTWWGFPTFVCGYDATVVDVYNWLSNNRRLGLRPVGVIADRDALELDGDENWYAGPWSEARELAEQKGVYWAVVVPPDGSTTELAVSITAHLNSLPHIHILSEFTGLPDHWARHQQIDGLTGIHLQQNLMLPLPKITKRLMDVTLAVIGGILLLPLLFYIAMAVKLSSRGPVLYANNRIGRDGRRFRMWKFRSMFTNSDAVLENYFDAHPDIREEWEVSQKLRKDPRITRIGRFIRVTSLDELPQLWNVIRGDMSLVGPRPILIEEEQKYGDFYGLYTMVSPGITGLWQVSGRSNTSYEERLQLVAYYVRNWSLWLDIYLLLRTVRIVLFGRGAR